MEAIEIPYAPRPWQQEVMDLCATHRFGVVVAHRRAGKSVLFANDLQREACRTTKRSWRGAFIAPTYAQAKAILWDHLKHYSRSLYQSKVVAYNESELRLDYSNGSRIRLFGADNPDSLRGLYFDRAVFDEFDMCKMKVWTEVVRPALADRQGSAAFIGTFKGIDGPLGQIYDLAERNEGWFTRTYKPADTEALEADELANARRDMSAEEYAREFDCVRTAAVRGTILGRLIDQADAEGRLTSVPHDPRIPVSTASDLGAGHNWATWFFQVVGAEVRFIDFVSGLRDPNGAEGIPAFAHYCNSQPYTINDHIAPHDIGIREYGTGRSRLETAASLGIHFRVLPRISQRMQKEQEERIEQARLLLPRCVFDQVKCKRGIDALRSWHRDENTRTGELTPAPVKDWADHPAEGFTYAAMGLREPANVERPKLDTRWIR